MAYAMTKRGSLDNQIANEFICDAAADLTKIDPTDITLGSIALVIDTMEIFIANSNKQWKSATPTEETEGGGE